MSLSTKCLHVSSTLWFKAQLVLCGGILNGTVRKNRDVSFVKNIVRKLSGRGRKRHLSQKSYQPSEEGITFRTEDSTSSSSPITGLQAKFWNWIIFLFFCHILVFFKMWLENCTRTNYSIWTFICVSLQPIAKILQWAKGCTIKWRE